MATRRRSGGNRRRALVERIGPALIRDQRSPTRSERILIVGIGAEPPEHLVVLAHAIAIELHAVVTLPQDLAQLGLAEMEVHGGEHPPVAFDPRVSQEPVQLREQDVQFQGRAGLVQQGKGWKRLTLLEGQTIAMGDLAVRKVEGNGKGGISLSVTVAPEPRFEAESSGDIRSVRISIPGEWEPVNQILVNGHMVKWAKDSEHTYLLPLRKAESSPPGSNRPAKRSKAAW